MLYKKEAGAAAYPHMRRLWLEVVGCGMVISLSRPLRLQIR